MILPLRTRHRRVMTALAIALPLLFVAGLRARRPVPLTAALPAAFESASHSETLGSKVLDAGGESIEVSWRDDSSGREPRRELRLQGASLDRVADPLVYWSRSAGTSVDKLPGDAALIGPAGVWGRVPRGIDVRGGRLIVYSLALDEVVAVLDPPAGSLGGG